MERKPGAAGAFQPLEIYAMNQYLKTALVAVVAVIIAKKLPVVKDLLA